MRRVHRASHYRCLHIGYVGIEMGKPRFRMASLNLGLELILFAMNKKMR